MSILAAVAALSAFMQITMIAWYSDGLATGLSENYFRLCMEKDGHFFDKADPVKVARKLQFEIKMIRSIGEHWAYVI